MSSKDNITNITQAKMEEVSTQVSSGVGRWRGLALEPVMNKMQSRVKEATNRVQQSYRSETEEDQDTARSPLDEFVPIISKEKPQPLVKHFYEKLATLDLSEHESRAVLAEMILEIIVATSKEILEVLRNSKFNINPPAESCVSQNAVKPALQQCLRNIFRSKCCTGHDSIDDILNFVSGEVTNSVNSTLSQSKFEDDRLVIAENTSYNTPKDKLKDMIRHEMSMFKDNKDKLSCAPRWSRVLSEEDPENLERETEATSEPVEEKQEEAPKRVDIIKEQLERSCRPCKARDCRRKERQGRTATPPEVSQTSPRVVTNTPVTEVSTVPEQDYSEPEAEEEQEGATNSSSCCRPCGGRRSEEAPEQFEEDTTFQPLAEEEPKIVHKSRCKVFKEKLRKKCDPCWSRVPQENLDTIIVPEPQEKVFLPSEHVYQRAPLFTPRSPKTPNEWDHVHIKGLAFEVASFVLQTENVVDLKDLSRELLQQLEPQISQWNVKVKPDVHHIKNVAKAVHKDLCRGSRKDWMTTEVILGYNISPEILDSIFNHLVTPEKKKLTFLRSPELQGFLCDL